MNNDNTPKSPVDNRMSISQHWNAKPCKSRLMIRTVEQNEIYFKLKKQPNDVQWLLCCSVLSYLLSLINFAYWHVISLKLLLLNVFMKTSFYWITVKVKARENAVLFTVNNKGIKINVVWRWTKSTYLISFKYNKIQLLADPVNFW